MEYRTKSLSQHLERQRGFTIVELLLAMGVSLVAMAACMTVFIQVFRGISFLDNRIEERMQVRGIISNLYRETRSTAQVHITQPTAFEFTYKDLSMNVRRVRYAFDELEGVLTRIDVDSGVVRTLSGAISEAKFSYFDRFGNSVETLNESNINVNAIQLTFLNHHPSQTGMKSIRLESPVIMFRNKPLMPVPPDPIH
jgi:prepilin-type N-terminal cleavage/methylation domain-containing protein